MLILSRKPKEQIIIGSGTENEITITVTEFKGNQVQIGIEAPRGISVHRKEVQEKIDKEVSNAAAVG